MVDACGRVRRQGTHPHRKKKARIWWNFFSTNQACSGILRIKVLMKRCMLGFFSWNIKKALDSRKISGVIIWFKMWDYN
jgi:hypothetical protein